MTTFPRVVAAVTLLAVAACGDSARPTVAEWEARWAATASSASAATARADQLTEENCEALLRLAREARPDLVPSPTERLEALVKDWIAEAETIGLDCARHPDLAAAIRELHLTGGEIDALLGDTGGSG